MNFKKFLRIFTAKRQLKSEDMDASIDSKVHQETAGVHLQELEIITRIMVESEEHMAAVPLRDLKILKGSEMAVFPLNKLRNWNLDEIPSLYKKEDGILGLPHEILSKILSYIVPDCKNCFKQREILKLGRLCKRMNELVRDASLYKEMRLINSCCPLPSISNFCEIIDRSTMFKRLECRADMGIGWKEREFVLHAVQGSDSMGKKCFLLEKCLEIGVTFPKQR